ncbi:MAG: PAS domain S-box protein [Deltaproteobacteria bacterium]|nr:PAS domain S-box protein [Deltaproteobacteria bacterium]
MLDTEPEPEFDELVRLATLVCRTPFGHIGLVDRERVFFKARVGFPLAELPRDEACSAWVLLGTEPLVIPDLGLDERFQATPGLSRLPVRFYAGAPLLTQQGLALGALSVLDVAPSALDPAQVEGLAILARQVSARIELRRAARQQEKAHAQLSQTLFELANREARLAAVLDTAVEGIVTIDGKGTIQSFNRAAERIFGWAGAEVLGRNVSLLMPEPDHSRHDTYLRRYLETGRAHVIGHGREVRGLRKDGSVFPLYLAVSEVRPCSRGRLFTGILRDISDLKEADRLKREFVSVVSHELRTPIASIRGALGLLEGGAAGPLSEQGAELSRIALSNADRVTRLVGDILDLGKLEAGRLELFLQPVSARDLAAEALQGIRPLADEAGVPLSLQGEDAQLMGDRDRLLQVLTNLVANAVKFSPLGSPVVLAIHEGPTRVRFEVVDRGPGISQQDLPRLFQRFQQLDGSDRRLKGGTGLGLAISKALVEQHGGTIGVQSEPGVGSTFWFEVPRGGPSTAMERENGLPR